MKGILFGKFNCLLLCIALGMAIGEAAATTIGISDSPLQTAVGVPPNVLFVIDDSGSMEWGFLPDALGENLTSNGRRLSENCTGIGNYGAVNNTCYLNTSGKAYMMSPHLNKAYYDNNKVYLPPVNSSGQSLGNASFTSARLSGYVSSCTSGNPCIDLADDYRAIMANNSFTGYYWGNWRTGFTISPDAKGGEAFYYEYNQGCAYGDYDDRCYTYKTITADKQTNFANWFSYYRNRMASSKWAIAKAFTEVDDDVRVGYGSINTSDVVINDVAPFSSARSSFYTSLFKHKGSGNTPLRTALNSAGIYFSGDKPWRDNPSDSDSPIRSCRQSFTVLMTDGYYNDTYGGIGNTDNTDGPTINGPGAQSYQYKPSGTFQDDYNNTLADIAMHYWNRDLLPNVENRVPIRNAKINPAFWQNMTTFGVSLGLKGNVDATAAIKAIQDGTNIIWNDPQGSAEAKLDDLLHAAVNSRGDFFNANDAEDFADKLSKALLQITKGTGSASNLGGVSTSSQTGAKVFQGRYQSEDWAGDLWTYDADNGMQVAWKASEGIPSAGNRVIKYFKNSTVTDFTKDNVTSTELALTAVEAANKDKLVDYLRGDQTHEQGENNGVFRKRSSLLGDIAHSAPLYVGAAERRNYHRNGWIESASYLNYIEANKARKGVVYVGANDGMLHAFSDDATLGGGTGKELFAYIPQAVLPRLKHLANPDYQHQYYVDGVLTGGDAYIGSGWKTVVIGTLGRGAAGSSNSIFALNVTNPAEITPMWEVPYAELGQNTGKVLIARTVNGDWVGIIGYGYNNATNKGGILVFNLADGALIKKIALPNSSTAPNGFGQLESWDADMDGNVDYVYAGDFQGNIWKFDISKSNTSQWGIANSNNPIFTAEIDGVGQSITSGLSISREPNTGRIWVMFGTGSYLSVGDKSDTSKQTIYGIVDETDDSKTSVTLTRGNLKARTFQESGDYRALPESTPLSDSDKGWYIDLGAGGERVVLPPLMIDSVLVINTLKPDDDPCKAGGISWRMAIDPYRGGRLKRNFFNTANFSEDVPTSGVKTESPTVGYTVIKTKDKDGQPIYTEVSGQGDASTPPSRPINVVALGRRLTWRELTNEQ